MGNVAKVNRLVVSFTVGGSDCCTLLNAASTSCSVWYISTLQSKNRLTSADPRLVVERPLTSPGTMLIASSIGLVMVTCICSTGITPLSTPITTRGKFVVGNTDMGIWVAREMPATVTTIRKKKMVLRNLSSQKCGSCC